MDLVGELEIARGRLERELPAGAHREPAARSTQTTQAPSRAARAGDRRANGSGRPGLRALSAARARDGANAWQGSRLHARRRGHRARSIDARPNRRSGDAPSSQRARSWCRIRRRARSRRQSGARKAHRHRATRVGLRTRTRRGRRSRHRSRPCSRSRDRARDWSMRSCDSAGRCGAHASAHATRLLDDRTRHDGLRSRRRARRRRCDGSRRSVERSR